MKRITLLNLIMNKRETVLVFALLCLGLGPPANAGVIGAEGDLYVSSYLGDNVVQFDGTTGVLVATFTTLDGPAGLLFKSNGDLLVAGCDSNNVLEFDATTGAPIGVFANAGLDGPEFLLFGPNGNLFVDSWHNDRVLEFDGTTGALIGTFASGGGLNRPYYMVFKFVDSDGDNVANVVAVAVHKLTFNLSQLAGNARPVGCKYRGSRSTGAAIRWLVQE